MSLGFYLGPSGSGKSIRLFKDIIDMSIKKRDERFIVIVPDQFTMSTQKEIVNLHKNHAIMNIDVLSFDRLAFKVFNELNIKTNDILTDDGKNIVLRKILCDKKEELKILGSSINKNGYISEIRSLISELSQYGIGASNLDELKKLNSFSDRFKYKISDIELIYKSFNEFIEEKFINKDELLDRLIKYVDDSDIVLGSTIILDGFTGFTPIQIKLIKRLLPLVKDMFFSITLDEREIDYSKMDFISNNISEEELFYLSKNTIKTLSNLAISQNIPILKPKIMIDTLGIRYKNSKELSFLERNIFRNSNIKYDYCDKEVEEHKIEDIHLIRTANKSEELTFIASKIRELSKEKNYRYSDFLVLSSNIDGYSYKVEEVFNRYDIPVFIDQNLKISNNPLILFTINLFKMYENRYKKDYVIRFLKSGCFNISSNDIHLLEYYITVMNFKTKKSYFNPFTKTSNFFTEEMVVKIEEIRKEIFLKLTPFIDVIRKKSTVSDISKALYNLIVSFDIPSYLEKRSEFYLNNKEYNLEKEYKNIYKSFINLLDNMVSLLGDYRFNAKEYRNILESGFSTLKLGVIPENKDSVIFGDIDRSRILDVKVLFLCGSYDGMIPKIDTRGGIISEIERNKLKESGVILSPTTRERAFLQRFYLYLYLTKAKEKLYITSPKMDTSGKSLKESYIYTELLNMYDDLVIEDIEDNNTIYNIVSKETAKATLIRLLSSYQKGYIKDYKLKLLSSLLKMFNDNYRDDLRVILNNIFYVHTPDKLETLENIYGIQNSINSSISKLETYASCPFSYYLKYLLKLDTWETDTFDSMYMGNFYHNSLELYAKEIKNQGKKWKDITEEESNNILENAMNTVYKSKEIKRFLDDKENVFIIDEIKETLRVSVPIIRKDIISSDFEPYGVEVDFKKIKQNITLDSLTYELSKGKMDFTGKIDRLDTYSDEDGKIYVKIIDYKSSNKEIDASKVLGGLDIQMFVYMDAALEMVNKETNKETIPAGVYYIHITDEIKSNAKDNEESLKTAILQKNKGIINSDPNIMNALSENTKITKVNEKTETKRRLSTDEWKNNLKKIRDFIQKEGENILNGDIDKKPYSYKGKNGCEYCPYKNLICHFDKKVKGYNYRDIELLEFKNLKGE